MRPVLHGDLTCAARALMMRRAQDRAGLAKRLVAEAEAADRYVKRFGRPHARWGQGSLMAVARRRTLAAEPHLDDPDYCDCLILMLTILAAHRRRSEAGANSCAIRPLRSGFDDYIKRQRQKD